MFYLKRFTLKQRAAYLWLMIFLDSNGLFISLYISVAVCTQPFHFKCTLLQVGRKHLNSSLKLCVLLPFSLVARWPTLILLLWSFSACNVAPESLSCYRHPVDQWGIFWQWLRLGPESNGVCEWLYVRRQEIPVWLHPFHWDKGQDWLNRGGV